MTLLATLGRAWDDHRPYVALAALVFAVGAVLGVALDLAGVDLFGALGLGIAPGSGARSPPGSGPGVGARTDVGPLRGRLTVGFVLANNTRVFVLLLVGVLSLGLFTAFALLVNGVLLGYVGAVAVSARGLGLFVLAVAPHGVLELPALFVAGAVAFRLLHRVGQRLLGRRDSVLDGAEWRRTAVLVAAAWVVLAAAAVVEIEFTLRLVRAVA